MDSELYKDLYQLLRVGIESALETLEAYDTRLTRPVAIQKLSDLLGLADTSIDEGAVSESSMFVAEVCYSAQDI